MRWWKHLYMGSHAAKKRSELLRGIREKAFLPEVYVITLPESGNHILDIRPVGLLKDEERKSRDFLILGVAKGYGESKELIRQMIDDMYQRTGSFDWRAYMAALDREAEAGEET